MKRPEFNDEYWMAIALMLAGEGRGLTRPNPPVGAVVVKHRRIIGMGFHPKAGQPHAEVFALADAGSAARGATLYVTLEPCCTHGRTPPCTEAIKAAGIARVVYGCDDPNPAHAGRAASILRRHGIPVRRNVLFPACRDLIAPFVMHKVHGRPFVTLKLASTLDGRIADKHGSSKWITGEDAREIVQDLRRCADAVMIGAGTLKADNPSLLPRPSWGRAPYRVIVSDSGSLPVRAKVFTDEAADRTLVFVPKDVRSTALDTLARRGIRIIRLAARGGRISLRAILKTLAGMDIMHVLCEGGGGMAESLIRARVCDEIKIFYAPLALGSSGLPCVSGPGWTLDRAPRFRIVDLDQAGPDILVTLKPTEQN